MAVLDDFLVACGNYDGEEPDDVLQEASTEILAFLKEDEAIRQRLFQSLPRLDPYGAGWVAIVLGTLAEQGFPAEPLIDPLVDLLRKQLAQLPQWNREPAEDGEVDIPELDPAQGEIADALPILCQALVALVATAPEKREQLSRDHGLDDALDLACAYSHGAVWLLSLLRRRSGLLLVLHPESNQGFRLSFKNVENCYHLFSLIQVTLGTLLPGGRVADKALAKAARGKHHLQALEDRACWHYELPNGKTLSGEASIDDITRFGAEHVLLLGPCQGAGEHWDSSFFGPSLQAAPSNMRVKDRLDASEVRHWLQRVRTD